VTRRQRLGEGIRRHRIDEIRIAGGALGNEVEIRADRARLAAVEPLLGDVAPGGRGLDAGRV
jgi:hypothetical protein